MRLFVLFVAATLIATAGDAVDDYCKDALAALKKGDADMALDLVEKALVADPRSPQALTVRGLVRSAQHKPADAVADFDKALEIDPKRVDVYDYRGDAKLKLGLFQEAVDDFDRFLEARPKQAPGHWRRGIALYYAGQYDAGRKQFAAYEDVDANDVENAVWHFLCAARADGVEKAQSEMLKIGKDARVPMMTVYDLYRGKAKPGDVLAAADAGDATDAERKRRLFYAHLYLGLYYDATGDKRQALDHITLAAHKYYLGDYMEDVARVHENVLLKDKEAKPK